MATSGSKRTGSLAKASTTVKRDKATGGWQQKNVTTGKFAKLKDSGGFKSVRTER